MFTQRATDGELEIIEETEASLALGLRATLAGVGFMPGLAWLGTDLLKVRPDVRLVNDPYSDRQYVAFPAIRPDVTVIHALEADPWGNARLQGNLALDRELATAAPCTIVTAERIVPRVNRELDIVAQTVTAVVEAPGGARPTSCYPNYPLDAQAILDYIETCGRGQFAAYLARYTNLRNTAPHLNTLQSFP